MKGFGVIVVDSGAHDRIPDVLLNHPELDFAVVMTGTVPYVKKPFTKELDFPITLIGSNPLRFVRKEPDQPAKNLAFAVHMASMLLKIRYERLRQKGGWIIVVTDGRGAAHNLRCVGNHLSRIAKQYDCRIRVIGLPGGDQGAVRRLKKFER